MTASPNAGLVFPNVGRASPQVLSRLAPQRSLVGKSQGASVQQLQSRECYLKQTKVNTNSNEAQMRSSGVNGGGCYLCLVLSIANTDVFNGSVVGVQGAIRVIRACLCVSGTVVCM